MIIFLYGPDTFRSQRKLEDLVLGYKEANPSGVNFQTFDLEEKSPEVKYFNFSPSLFPEKIFLIFKNTSADKDFQANNMGNIEKLSSSGNIYVFYEKDSECKGDFLKTVKKHSKNQEFKTLSASQLKVWLEEVFNLRGGKIEPDAVGALIFRVGNDLWRMENEIIKLLNFKGKQTVTQKDIKLLVKSKIETDIFKTIDAISQKDKKTALRLLSQHIEKGEAPLYLLSMIQYQFRNLLVIKDLIKEKISYADILKISKLHPFVVKKSYVQAQKFSTEELKEIYQKFFQADLAAKTGKTDPVLILEMLVGEL